MRYDIVLHDYLTEISELEPKYGFKFLMCHSPAGVPLALSREYTKRDIFLRTMHSTYFGANFAANLFAASDKTLFLRHTLSPFFNEKSRFLTL